MTRADLLRNGKALGSHWWSRERRHSRASRRRLLSWAFWNGLPFTRVDYGTINKKAYRNGGIFQKISLSFKQIAIKLQFGIARYHIRCWNINMYTVWSFEHVPILCVVWVQHCLWRYCVRYVHKIVFKFSLICNISISRHVATEFRWFIEHAGVAIKLVSKNWLFIRWKYTTFTLQSCNHDESQYTLFFKVIFYLG